MENKTILIVDDTSSNIDILVELLDEKYDVIPALDGEFALEVANEDKPDLILLDIMMPDMDGFEVCTRLKADENTKDIPVIFITANTDEESIENAYDIGGTDYVTKPFRPKELLSRVKKELQIQDMVNKLKLLASTDPMTKLFNRRHFTDVSQSLLELAKRNESNISVVMIDIDKFKNINDTYGHKVGDDVIIALALLLQEHARKSDLISRWGGEEFIALLPHTDIKGAFAIAQRIREDVQNQSIKLDDNQELKFTISIGVSTIDNKLDKNMEASVKKADDALYRAKEGGRNQVCINQ